MEKSEKYIDGIKSAAEQVCRDLKHSYIGTEHIFLVLLSDKDTPIVSYLKDFKITKASFLKELKRVVGEGTLEPETVEYTPLVKNILGEARSVAFNKGIEVTPELLMLQLLRCSEGVAIRLMESLGFNDREQDNFDQFLCDQISISNIGVDLGDEFESDILSDLKGSEKGRFNCLTDLRKVVKDEGTIVVGFDKELEELIKALLRYKKPNIILTGEPGVGKTALVEKLAIAINNGEVPPIIANYKILQLSISAALAGTRYRGEFEEKLEGVLSFVSKSKNTILFIDEIHNIVGAGSSCESTLDAGNILKPYLARGAVKIIGATTTEEYERIKDDGALARRFKNLEILEPDTDQTMEILKAMKPVMQKHYGVKLTDKELREIYKQSTYRKGRMPDVALDEMEEYCINIYYDKSKKEKVSA